MRDFSLGLARRSFGSIPELLRRSRITIALLAALTFALSGCNQNIDLSSIRALAATTAASADSYSTLANDFYDSCNREYNWLWAAAKTHARFRSLDYLCGDNARTRDQWQKANLVVLSYVRALGALAGGSDTGTDFGISDLLSGIGAVSGSKLTSDQTSAISTAS